MKSDFEIYDGKTVKDLCKDIVVNSEQRKSQIDILVNDLRSLIKTPNDALLMIPMIKEYFDVGVKNDEQLTKLLSVIQKMMSNGEESSGEYSFLSEEEKKQLLSEMNSIVAETSLPVKKIEKKV
jgi:hypothetical protein